MKKKINNYLNSIPYRLFSNINFFYETLISLEEIFWNKKYQQIENDLNLYVCGYPRSGTTVISNFLNSTKKFSSYTHKDMPLILSPILWSKISNIYYAGFKEIRRKHGDSLNINLSYVDSFEEIIWKNYKEKINFFELYKKNIKKICYLKKSTKFLSKSNQNLGRINLISENIYNAKFLVIFRNPISQLKSLLKVNDIFFKEIKNNNYFLQELNFLGHFEFGPKRKFIFKDLKNLDEIKKNWFNGNFALSYIQEWIEVHEMILKNFINRKNVKIINYDNLKNNCKEEILNILKFCEVEIDEGEYQKSIKIFDFKSSSSDYILNNDENTKLQEKIIIAEKLYKNLSNIIN